MSGMAVMAMAYGTPATPADIEPYYTHIRHGRPPSPELLIELRERYEAIGGRSPLLDEPQIAAAGLNYTVNDISETELSHCPDWAEKICFDIAGDAAPAGQYDLIFSRMVQEHVRSAEKCYNNIFQLLRPGGIALNFHPTLFAVPFVFDNSNSVAKSGAL